MKVKSLFLLIAMLLTGGLTALAQEYSITLKFQGDEWRNGLYLETPNNVGNVSGMEAGEIYKPTDPTFEFKFKAPFQTDVAEPGLNIMVAKGYTINVAIEGGEGLINSSLNDDPNADYFLTGGGDGGAFFAKRRVDGLTPAGNPELATGYNLTLWSAKMDGATFVVTVNANSNMYGLKFVGYGFEDGYTINADSSDPTTVYSAYAFIESVTQYPVSNPMARQNITLYSDYTQFEYTGQPTVLQFVVRDEGFTYRVSCEGLEEGPNTYMVTSLPSLLGGSTIRLTVYSADVIGKTFVVEVATPGTDLPSVDEPAGTAPAPTVNPAEGAYPYFSGPVSVIWENSTITLADNTKDLTIELEGEVVESDQWSWNYVDAEGEILWDDVDLAAGISINLPWTWLDLYTYKINIPEGMFAVTGDEGTALNAELNLEYTGVAINDDITCNPPKGSQLSSLSEFTMSWDNYEAILNEACTTPISVMDSNTYEIVGLATITSNGDNTFKVTLDEPYTTQGYVNIQLPEGLFKLNTVAGEVESPTQSIMYNISLFSVVPSSYSYVYEPFGSFEIYSENIELKGNAEDIILYYYDGDVYENDGYIEYAKCNSVVRVYNDLYGEGLKVEFDKIYDVNGVVQVVVPAGMFSFDGEVYNSRIVLDYYLEIPVDAPEPIVTPDNGSTVEALDCISLSWNDSPLYESYVWEENGSEPFTLTYTSLDGETVETVDVTENVRIDSVEEDNGTWFPVVVSSELVLDFSDAPYTNDGKYVVFIPANYVEIENYSYALNQALVLEYYIGETNKVGQLVAAEEGEWTVYNTNGVLVLRTADETALRALTPGLYIINGKKVILK